MTPPPDDSEGGGERDGQAMAALIAAAPDADAGRVLAFWFQEATPQQWFVRDSAFDARIAGAFSALHGLCTRALPTAWRESAAGILAGIIVLDQFSRNLHRDDPRAFAHDEAALALSMEAIERGLDRALPGVARKFLYMPFQHAEDAAVQDRSITLFADLGDADVLDFARRHRDIIVRFGRFPHRNAVLGRRSSAEELQFLQEPGSSF